MPEGRDKIEGWSVSRRILLKGAVAASALGSLVGTGSAQADGAATDSDDSTRYIVGTEPNATASSMGARASSVERVLDFGAVGGAVVGQFASADATALEQDSDVRYVERDRTYEASDQTHPWGVDRIDADATTATGNAGSGAHVAIIDSGIDQDHPDLEANLGTGRSFVDYTNSWDDDLGHGTHCAGIVGAVDNGQGVVGVAPDATVHAGKVLDENGFGSWSDIAAGIEWAANQGYDVINLSLGGSTFSQTLADACNYAYNEGVLPVAAAGNGYGASVEYPAAYAPVLAVSATTESDSLASFSNLGPNVELAAPGANVYSTVPDGEYGHRNGTSMACPHVAGVAGILMSSDGGDDSSDQARAQLHETAEDIGLSGNEQGFGLVDAEAAVGNTSIGEVGRVSTTQPDRGTWHSVSFAGSYDSVPVVVMKPISHNHHETCHVRLRNVTTDGFEYQIEEWDYQNRSHADEIISYLVFESGQHTLDDGTAIEVDRVTVDDSFAAVSTHRFDQTPVVVSQSQTANGGDAIVTRTKAVTTTGFDVRVQEEEANGPHAEETVGYIAIDPGQGQTRSKSFEVGRRSGVTENWKPIGFLGEYDQAPRFIADMQTFNGSDPATIRYRNLGSSGVDVQVEEEQSRDSETNHNRERVGYIAIEGDGVI